MRNYESKKVEQKIKEVASIDTEEYRSLFTNPDKDFTRDRKLAPSTIVRAMLLNSGTNLNEQLRLVSGIGDDRPTASAFIQGRDKLTEGLYRKVFETTTGSTEHTLFDEKYLVIACDGSDVNIFPKGNDPGTAVSLNNNPYGKSCRQVHLNALCTVPDGLFEDFLIQDHRDENEIRACIDMMKNVAGRELGHPVIITCDRGYENYNLMMHADHLGLKYCVRLKDVGSTGISSTYKGMVGTDGCLDTVVSRRFTRCMNAYRKPGFVWIRSANDFVPPSPNKRGRQRRGENAEISSYEFSFRLVRFKIAEDSYEVLATNLTQDEMPLERMKDLYHLRWGIETAFRQMKYDDCSSFQHSKKKAAAIGEIILSLAFHNICVRVLLLCAKKLARRHRLKHRMYVYKISYSDLADVMRFYISGRDPTITPTKIVRELEITAQPVREGRKFERFLLPHTFTAFIYRAA